ncbi:MAG: T9SS type A sorting domain-containing protein [Bacteroidia bacterium]
MKIHSLLLIKTFLLLALGVFGQDKYEFWAYVSDDWSNAANWDYTPSGGSTTSGSPGAVITANTEVYIWENVDYDLTTMLQVNGKLELTGGNITTSTNANIRFNTGSSLVFSSSNTLTMGRLFQIDGTINVPTNSSMSFTSSSSNSLRGSITLNGSMSFNGSVNVNSSSSINIGSFAVFDCNNQLSNSGNITNTGTLNVASNLTNSGTITSSSSGSQINIDGSNLQSVSGLSAFKVNVNNANNIALSGDLNILAGGVLNMQNGNITTGQHKVVLNAGAEISGETSARYIIGQTRTSESMVTANLYDFGNIGVNITLSGTSPNAGNVLVDRFTGTHTASGSNLGLSRYITIASDATNFTSAKIDLSYFDSEIPSIYITDESAMKAFITDASQYNPTSVSAVWTNVSEQVDATNNVLTFSDISPFQFNEYAFTGGGHQQSLPVVFSYFNANWQLENTAVKLNWQTAMEENNSHFNVERSFDATNWATVGRVEGQGTTFDITNYQFIDHLETINEQEIIYYRLKQIDHNGNFDFSEIKNLNFYTETSSTIEVWPNPVSGFNINISAVDDYEVLDMSGLVLKRVSNQNRIDISELCKGIYFIRNKKGVTSLFTIH